MRNARKLLAGAGLATAMVVGAAAPAFAHDCINVSSKTRGATVGTFVVDPKAPGGEGYFTPSGGKGNKPFIKIDATRVGGGTYLLYLHNGPDGVIPAVNSSTICDAHGVTSLEMCIGG